MSCESVGEDEQVIAAVMVTVKEEKLEESVECSSEAGGSQSLVVTGMYIVTHTITITDRFRV